MSFAELNASSFGHIKDFYISEFEDILSKVIVCYNLMVNEKVLLKNDENAIRDILLINYLKDNTVRQAVKLTDYLFDREVPEDRTIGRTDIKIQTLNTFLDTSAYYIIECKRLDSVNTAGTTGLNAKYIENGIFRFVSNTYSTYNRVNGMIGFVVEPLDINKNIDAINGLLKTNFTQVGVVQDLQYFEITPGWDFSYCSTHTVGGTSIIIYHLMLDYSLNIA